MAFAPFDLTGKVALITGGNGGLGLGMARGLAQAGADVVIWGTNAAKNAEAAANLEASGARVLAQQIDITDEKAVIDGMAEAVAKMGRIDGAVANAGIVGEIKPVTAYTADDFDKVLAVNVRGAFFTLREACRHMIERAKAGDPGGSLIGIGSIGGIHGAGRTPAYGTSKGALPSLVRSLAVENARHGIRGNTIYPGWFSTDISAGAMEDPKYQALVQRVPMRRMGQPDDVAGIAIYLVSDASRFHTGDSIVVDGGYTVF